MSERKASVPLQALLNHTSARFAITLKEVFESDQVKINGPIELISKTGFDGSTGHSRYNQKWTGEQGNENHMLLTAVCPLLLHFLDEKGVFWSYLEIT